MVKSLVQIPGSDDLLMFTHGGSGAAAHRLYRFNAASGAWKQVFDLKQVAGGYAQPQGYPALL